MVKTFFVPLVFNWIDDTSLIVGNYSHTRRPIWWAKIAAGLIYYTHFRCVKPQKRQAKVSYFNRNQPDSCSSNFQIPSHPQVLQALQTTWGNPGWRETANPWCLVCLELMNLMPHRFYRSKDLWLKMHAASIGNYRFKDVQSVSLWTSVTNTKELTHPLVHCPTLNESVLVTAPRQGQLKLLFKRLGMLQEEHEAAECSTEQCEESGSSQQFDMVYP